MAPRRGRQKYQRLEARDSFEEEMAAHPISLHKLDESGAINEKATPYAERSPPPELREQISLDSEKPKKNPFLDPKVAEHYRAIYESVQYECRHVFDPYLEWSEKDEKKLVRKLDWHVSTLACFMFFALNLDRGNLKQAVSDNMLDQLNLSTDDYNYGNTIFSLSFLVAELPSQLISKRIGPDRWIPAQMVLWSIVAAAQAKLQGKSSFYACRALLGLLEGGFIPDLILWMSYFYTSSELTMRLSYFWITANLTSVLNSFLAWGLLHMDGVHGWAGWRWLFLIEGLITLIIGLVSFPLMPASAVQTKAWYRPNGWFTEKELGITVNRVLRDDPSKGDMHNRMAITPNKLWRACCDYDLWPLYLIGLTLHLPREPPNRYLTLTLRGLGFSTLNTNLLSIPCEVISCFTLYAISQLSLHVKESALVCSIQDWWLLPCLIALRTWPQLHKDKWGTYALTTVLLSNPAAHAIIVSWVSRNSGSVRTRTVSAALYNMTIQASNVIGSNIYRDKDKPLYHRGNDALIALDVFGLVLFYATKGYYVWTNRRRERRWAAMDEVQRAWYLDHTRDEGNKRLDFRFAH
ncbi:putative MFS transporter [Teratosphaeria nubilosa]|uniref:Putative MFS transporter n=1 Tax=Teratosphaeria nubilosa TaxID=161662 RepID=A0A6G1L7A4_9PEZI|nr:putative MFS transporter [Teratosphaeria nubilosa]